MGPNVGIVCILGSLGFGRVIHDSCRQDYQTLPRMHSSASDPHKMRYKYSTLLVVNTFTLKSWP